MNWLLIAVICIIAWNVVRGELPYTIGGGIGQSRLCMLLLGSAHIGEVQASVWDNATREACEKAGIPLL